MQPEFCAELLMQCKEHGVNTAIETSAYCDWKAIEMVLELTDYFIIDIKILDEKRHIETTGASNKLILENIDRLSRAKAKITIRTPIVPGVNDCTEEIGKITEYVNNLNEIQLYELLPFHKTCVQKYKSLGMEYPAAFLTAPTDEVMMQLRKLSKR